LPIKSVIVSYVKIFPISSWQY